MNNSKHTPGPWFINNAKCLDRNEWVIEIQSKSDFVADTKNEANAHLITAAPDLLEALNACRTELMRLSPTASRDAIAAANTAIAKATGGKDRTAPESNFVDQLLTVGKWTNPKRGGKS